jgi:hypothetical protein
MDVEKDNAYNPFDDDSDTEAGKPMEVERNKSPPNQPLLPSIQSHGQQDSVPLLRSPQVLLPSAIPGGRPPFIPQPFQQQPGFPALGFPQKFPAQPLYAQPHLQMQPQHMQQPLSGIQSFGITPVMNPLLLKQQQRVQPQQQTGVSEKSTTSKDSDKPRSVGPWTEHTSEDGKIFYFNKETNQSVWDKPEVFKDEKEKLIESCPWKSYTTDDGKEYYHNEKTDTTQWEMPAEYAAHKSKIEQLAKKEDVSNKLDGDLSLLTKEEKQEIFSGALKRAGVLMNMSQDDAFNLIKSTKEWTSFKTSEKKAFFHQYIADLKVQEQKEQRRKEQQNAENFIKMLFECEEITTSTRFRDAMTLVCTNPIYLAVNPNEKEKLFDIFMRKKEDKVAAEAAERKKLARDTFIQLMLHSSITLDTQWRDFKDEKKDDPVFTNISLSDAIDYFQVYLKEVEKIEDSRLQTKQKEIITRSRKIRLQYKALLVEELGKGEITKKSTWSNFRLRILNDQRYLDMLEPDIDGSTPAEIFYDIVMDLEEKFERDMKRVKEILKDVNFTLTPTITIESFLSKINDHQYYEYVDEANIEPIFLELQEKALRHMEKTKATAKKRFSEILLLCSLTREITWDTLVPHLARPDINFLPLNDEEKSEIFKSEMERRVLEDDFQKIISTEPRREKELELEKERDREKDKHRSGRDRDESSSRRKHRDDREKDKHDYNDRDSYRDNRDDKDKKYREDKDKYSRRSPSRSRSPSPSSSQYKRRRSDDDRDDRDYEKKYRRDK